MLDLQTVKKSRMPLADEPNLVRQAKVGDSDAFGTLYDAYLERIYRFVYFRVEDQQTAEDITSQVFLKAWENLGRFQIGGTPFLAWLYTIAHNAVIDHYRTRKVTAALEDVRLSDPGHAEMVENGIDAAVEMSNEEIARQLGKREGAIRALQMRGLKALSKRLTEKIPI